MTLPSTNAQAMLEVRNLNAGYGAEIILFNVSIEIKRGQAVAVLGPNGAGKTTLLRAISGLVPNRSGEINFDGRGTGGLAPYQVARLGIAHVPEGRALFPSLTVEENLIVGALGSGSHVSLKESYERVLKLFPWMSSRLQQAAGTLSGGQQQMVAIGRGLMSNPQVMLLDEPSLGLAPKVIDDVYEALARIRDGGVAMLLVEQNARYGLSFATQAYVLNHGQVITSGTPDKLAGADFNTAYFYGR